MPRSRSDDAAVGISSLGTLHFTVSYDAERRALSVTVVKATDLPVDHLDSSNPYVKLQLLPDKRQKAKTRVVKRTANPVYDESFTFYGIEADQLATTAEDGSRRHQQKGWNCSTLHMAVLSFDSFARDELIGEVLYDLNDEELGKKTTSGRTLSVSRTLCSRNSGKVRLGLVCAIKIKY